ncbi:carboxymuconolactone decarboxylase family protein [Bacillus sp. FSL M8-0052]|nr:MULTISPECIES: carboxymuconolactone decarboxylase family protein [Bacillus]KKB73783.1 4-carboxymuconolactone decarboxylase [Bacillus sp. TH008]MDU0073102.1 carboxymuconolactone decarboxylase family protein [Bacillus sp. IG6]MED8020892.1 carboxymuconolactone decarboxylase family protein [Bacillus glycinifermentans]WKB75471.1 carboxymuconolactone decarboxylase family protein [Bacillus glycinifermentans]SCA86445.1 4-carboxymuconolactone decarboxylase [Bacillus glycinifermentans]
MEKDRLHQGLDKLMEYTLTNNKEISTHLKISDELEDIAPDVSKYIIEFAYGDIYSRPGLTNQQRALVTMSSLVTQGTEPQLQLHINTALTSGLTPEEVVEAIIQLIPYTGFPRVLNALTIAKKVFTQRHVQVSTSGDTEQ